MALGFKLRLYPNSGPLDQPRGEFHTGTMPIRRYLDDHAAFDPEAIVAMSKALDLACNALHIDGNIDDRKTVATRIIDLARNGVIDAKALSERVIAETKALRSL